MPYSLSNAREYGIYKVTKNSDLSFTVQNISTNDNVTIEVIDTNNALITDSTRNTKKL